MRKLSHSIVLSKWLWPGSVITGWHLPPKISTSEQWSSATMPCEDATKTSGKRKLCTTEGEFIRIFLPFFGHHKIGYCDHLHPTRLTGDVLWALIQAIKSVSKRYRLIWMPINVQRWDCETFFLRRTNASPEEWTKPAIIAASVWKIFR